MATEPANVLKECGHFTRPNCVIFASDANMDIEHSPNIYTRSISGWTEHGYSKGPVHSCCGNRMEDRSWIYQHSPYFNRRQRWKLHQQIRTRVDDI